MVYALWIVQALLARCSWSPVPRAGPPAVSPRCIRSIRGNAKVSSRTQQNQVFAREDCRRPTTRYAGTKAEIENLICEHSQLYSRGQLGFTAFMDEERGRFAPVLQGLVRVHPPGRITRAAA